MRSTTRTPIASARACSAGASAAPTFQVARGRGVVADRLDDLDERPAGGQHGVLQAVVVDVGVVVGHLQAERGVQRLRHAVEVAGDEGHLADTHGGLLQRPWKTGARFSTKARKASAVSSVWNSRTCFSDSRAM